MPRLGLQVLLAVCSGAGSGPPRAPGSPDALRRLFPPEGFQGPWRGYTSPQPVCPGGRDALKRQQVPAPQARVC